MFGSHRARAALALVLVAAALLVGEVSYGFDPFLTIVAGLALFGALLALLVQQVWSLVAAAVLALLVAFVMFQVNSGGAAGDDPSDLAERLDGAPSVLLLLLAVAAASLAVAGIWSRRDSRV